MLRRGKSTIKVGYALAVGGFAHRSIMHIQCNILPPVVSAATV
ncbi:hypothetical protein HMPREF0454_03228 [Hafnia alvei ATCC 51873]|uniref:Uncharacterized protein n=1 Tax=Hafnia alvei ATCC 51873 TaxID=1002364 RepID=G9Y977_HAFAL|nr:hypothetical protein HMPREF0454_03228 [Hafnia alvei ATCC 51873]